MKTNYYCQYQEVQKIQFISIYRLIENYSTNISVALASNILTNVITWILNFLIVNSFHFSKWNAFVIKKSLRSYFMRTQLTTPLFCSAAQHLALYFLEFIFKNRLFTCFNTTFCLRFDFNSLQHTIKWKRFSAKYSILYTHTDIHMPYNCQKKGADHNYNEFNQITPNTQSLSWEKSN